MNRFQHPTLPADDAARYVLAAETLAAEIGDRDRRALANDEIRTARRYAHEAAQRPVDAPGCADNAKIALSIVADIWYRDRTNPTPRTATL